MIEPDELAQLAEELRAEGIDACHEIVYCQHAFHEGLDIGEDFFPLWELILPENCESFDRRDFAAIKARRRRDWSVDMYHHAAAG